VCEKREREIKPLGSACEEAPGFRPGPRVSGSIGTVITSSQLAVWPYPTPTPGPPPPPPRPPGKIRRGCTGVGSLAAVGSASAGTAASASASGTAPSCVTPSLLSRSGVGFLEVEPPVSLPPVR